MSLAASLVEPRVASDVLRKINLIDTPGDSGFQADTVASLRVVEGALVVHLGRDGRRGEHVARLGAQPRSSSSRESSS